MKKCPKCNRILPDREFTPHGQYCKLCRRDYDWQYKYGLSPEQYLTMWEEQEGKCKICGKEPPEGEYLHVDHNKETGEVRGLLCKKCNRGLGLFNDNPKCLIRAAEYVKENQ